jgi:hypothetical protein
MNNLSRADGSDLTKTANPQGTPVDSCEETLAAVANEFTTHPDFAEARADALLWDSTSPDGLKQPPS